MPGQKGGGSRRSGCVLAAAAGGVVTVASVVLWLVVERALGMLAAGAAVGALLAAPLGVGVAIERLAARMQRNVRAERVFAWLLPALSLLGLVLAVTTHRTLTGAALVEAPARHAWARGALGEVLGAAGRALAGGSSLPERPDARQPAPRPSIGPSARPSAEAQRAAPGKPAFSSGDASYREEPSCEQLSDVSRLAAEYHPGDRRATLYALAKARYPAGLPFLQAQIDAQLAAWFGGAPDSFEGTASHFDTAVHEGSHIWGFERFSPATQTYPVDASTNLRVKRLRNFPRSEILEVHVDRDSDPYAKTYLEGEAGAQGFNSLLDEYNAYAHSLASRYCTRDLLDANARVSSRDGILTFMYYVEVYLQLARTRHRADYTAILSDEGHRRMIVTVWDRAELWLRRSADEPRLGVIDESIAKWVYAPERLDEIARVRARLSTK
jgi:hypothetical protein